MKKLLALAVLLGFNAQATEVTASVVGTTVSNLVSTANMGLTITASNPGSSDVVCALYDSTQYPGGVLLANWAALGSTNYVHATYTNLVLTYKTNETTFADPMTGTNTITNLVKTWTYTPTKVAARTNALPQVVTFTVPAASTVTKLVGVPFLRGTTITFTGSYTQAVTYTYAPIN